MLWFLIELDSKTTAQWNSVQHITFCLTVQGNVLYNIGRNKTEQLIERHIRISWRTKLPQSKASGNTIFEVQFLSRLLAYVLGFKKRLSWLISLWWLKECQPSTVLSAFRHSFANLYVFLIHWLNTFYLLQYDRFPFWSILTNPRQQGGEQSHHCNRRRRLDKNEKCVYNHHS